MQVRGGCCSPPPALLGWLWSCRPAAGCGGQGLCHREDLLYQTCCVLFLLSHNHLCIAVRLRPVPGDSCNTSHVLLLSSRHVFHIAYHPPAPPRACVQHSCGWTSPQPNPSRFSSGQKNLACSSTSLPLLPFSPCSSLTPLVFFPLNFVFPVLI